jgi:hypothetical protein
MATNGEDCLEIPPSAIGRLWLETKGAITDFPANNANGDESRFRQELLAFSQHSQARCPTAYLCYEVDVRMTC